MDELLRNPVFVSHALAAAASVSLGTTLTYPLDTIKTLIQVGSSSTRRPATFQVLGRVESLSGYSGLYRGFTWLTPGRVTSVGARFGVYEILTAYYKDGRTDNYVYVSEALSAGMAAGAVESFLNTPFEMISLRKKVSAAFPLSSSSSNSATKHMVTPMISKLLPGFVPDIVALDRTVSLLSVLSPKNLNMANALRNYPWMMTGSGMAPSATYVKRPIDIIKLEGLRSMWRGLRVGIARDSVFGGIFFGSWQFLHLAMLELKAVSMDPPELFDGVGPLSPLAVSLAAGFSGSLAGAASHPFDTSRTRTQCTVLPRYLVIERKFLKWGRLGNWFERLTGMHPADRKVLFRGISLRMARCGLASYILVGSYFLSVEHLVPKS